MIGFPQNIYDVIDEPGFMMKASLGLIDGVSAINKFGHNDDVMDDIREDIWDGGSAYTFTTTTDITHIRQVVDQAAMRGQIVEIQGLDSNWDLLIQTVVLDGTNTSTPVIIDTPLRRVFRMKILANVVGNQNIELRNVGGDITYSIIQAGNNQTLMAIYCVPRNYTALMLVYFASVTITTVKEPTSTEISLWSADRENNYEFQLKHLIGIPKSATPIKHVFAPPLKINEKNDVKISAFCVDKDGAVSAGFDLLLFNNDVWDL